MNASLPSMIAVAVLASFFCASNADAGRRNPAVPIVIAPPPGNITIHVEIPSALAAPPFGVVLTPPPSPIPPTPAKKRHVVTPTVRTAPPVVAVQKAAPAPIPQTPAKKTNVVTPSAPTARPFVVVQTPAPAPIPPPPAKKRRNP